MKDFVALTDYSSDEIQGLIDLSLHLKESLDLLFCTQNYRFKTCEFK